MRTLLGRPRTALLAATLLLGPFLGACEAGGGGRGGGGADDDTRVDTVVDGALEAVDGVLHELAEGVQMRFDEGNRFFSLCGDDLAPGGVVHTVTINFRPSELPDEKAADKAAEVLTAGGWTVERPENPRITIGTKDAMTIRVEFGPGAAVAQVTSDCVETSDRVARDYAKKSDEGIVWK